MELTKEEQWDLTHYFTTKFHRKSTLCKRPKRLGHKVTFKETRRRKRVQVTGKVLASFHHYGGGGYIIKRTSDGKVVQTSGSIILDHGEE